MPESGSALQKRLEAGISAVETRWRQLNISFERITAKQLSVYRNREPAMGWRLPVQFADQIRRVDILVSPAFPFSSPRIALVDRPPFLTWPHVEQDGVLCLIPEHSTLSVDDPYGAVAILLERTNALITRLARGAYQDEFKSEFLSYWGQTTTLCRGTVISLISPSPPSRTIRVYKGSSRIVAADRDDILQSWLRNLNSEVPQQKLVIEDGLFVWLDDVPLPSEYPENARQVYELAKRGGAAELLDEFGRLAPERLFVFFAAETVNGPAVVATVIERPRTVRNNDPLSRGFRPSRVPERVTRARLFGGSRAIRATVERVDPGWVHGRERDKRFAKLRGSTVLIFGCGSIGAPTAVALGHSGVGHLILTDHDDMKGANVGRHPLGVASINQPKATSLAHRLRADLPHLTVEARVCRAEALLAQSEDVFVGVDLIISTMGNWAAESMLDECHHAGDRKIPIVYGWTEAHAAAGHAVAIMSKGARFRDGLDATGAPRLVAAQWTEDPRMYEPACGATFEPYGPVELGYVTTLVTETAMDCLLDPPERSLHRIWLARRQLLDRAGGKWTTAIQKIAGFKLNGGITLERPWALDSAANVLAA